ncbi:MAG: 2-hydroxycarboxylate transporter family protein [Sphingomonadales bacterium]|nr:2-hydroxycarboxylate transporter family protein [Sphingomonadales bacterium]MDE2171565.1 2-hydroxycarboxylate transporter family protein [Sphingomonadales bacterium]
MTDFSAESSELATHDQHQNDGRVKGITSLPVFTIGIIPWPIYLVLLAVFVAFSYTEKIPSDISLMIAVLTVGGFTCAELGKRLPVISTLGAAAIFATFVPSYLTYAKALPPAWAKSVTTFTKDSQFLYLYIAAIIVGSVLSMDREVLVRGFVKIFVPILVGTLVAMAVGISVGMAFGMSMHDVIFYVVAPAMAGGVGEGAMPLSIGYAAILHQDQGLLLAHILPSVMFASLMAILFTGLLNLYGKSRPNLTGNGTLQMGEHDDIGLLNTQSGTPIGPAELASAGITAITLYLIGLLGQTYFKFPGPITMLLLAILLNLGRAVTPRLKSGAYAYYKFFSTAVTYPLLFAIGVALTPWDKLIAAFTPAMIITIVATVASLMASGFFVGRWLGMYPIEAAIVTGCRASQGGTGDVAILTACDRLQLMPFAQIATRIGGAATVTTALALLRIYG